MAEREIAQLLKTDKTDLARIKVKFFLFLHCLGIMKK